MTKKILLISYHFPPQNIIAAFRPYSFAQHLGKHHLEVTVVTHMWDQKNSKGLLEDAPTNPPYLVEEQDGYRVIRVKRTPQFMQSTHRFFNAAPPVRKAITYRMNARGHFHIHTYNSYRSIKSFLWEHLTTTTYDLVLTSFAPFYSARIAYEVHEKFGIPYVVDFRDMHDNRLAADDFVPAPKEKKYIALTEKYLQQWLSKALFIVSTSSVWANALAQRLHVKAHRITNGYELPLFEGIEKQPQQHFTIAHIGTLYEKQDLRPFIGGVQQFIQQHPEHRMKVSFIGLKPNNRDYILSLFEAAGLMDCFEASDRVPREEALQLLKNADVLFYPAWTTTRGTYSGKIFEYLATRNNILIAPNDKDVIEELMATTRAGVVANSAEEVAQQLGTWYAQWQAGQLHYEGIDEQITYYSREHQAQLLASLINNALT